MERSLVTVVPVIKHRLYKPPGLFRGIAAHVESVVAPHTIQDQSLVCAGNVMIVQFGIMEVHVYCFYFKPSAWHLHACFEQHPFIRLNAQDQLVVGVEGAVGCFKQFLR